MDKEIPEQIRQGDILLVSRKSVEKLNIRCLKDILNNIKDMKKIADKKHTLAYGEKTGHSHQLSGDVIFLENVTSLENPNATVVCQVGKQKSELVHGEHGVTEVPSEDWVVITQRELDIMEGVRRVSD